MGNRAGQRTDFGRDVDIFLATWGMTKRELAALTDTNYQFLSNCCNGQYGRAGHELKPKIYEFMKNYSDEHAGETV